MKALCQDEKANRQSSHGNNLHYTVVSQHISVCVCVSYIFLCVWDNS